MHRAIIIFISALIVSAAKAEVTVDFRSFEKPEISKLLHQASTQDGQRGLSVNELSANFGKPDSITNESSWNGGELYKYGLSGKRSLELDILNGVVVHGVIVTQDRGILLVWK
jgi:hypothetical protein